MIHRFVQRDQRRLTSQERILDVIRAPVMTEKSTIASGFGQYVFKVALDANKIEIKRAVEQLFKVKVRAVNTLRLPGKTKRFKGRTGVRSGIKKAVVTLEKGQTLDLTTGQLS